MEFTAEKILQAQEKLADVVSKTPLVKDPSLSERYGANIYLKQENFQVVRSFKLRGAFYAISNLPDEKLKAGVVAASAGNHAQGVAYTCQRIGVRATIFMPTTTPQQKINQVKFFGGGQVEIALIGDTFDESAKAAKEFAEINQMTFVDPFDDYDVIAGQGTVAYEIFEDAKQEGINFDYLLSAVGGGGLISGVSTYTKSISPATKVVGVEALGAQSMRAAFDVGHPVRLELIDKFADGIAVQEVGKKTFELARKYVDELLAVDEGLIASTIIDLYSKQGIVAEPAGATTIAALELIADEIKGKNVVCIVSGGNNDINRMPEIEERSLVYQGLKHYFIINFPQRPGALREFVNDVLGPKDDITRFEYMKKANKGMGPGLVGILLNEKEDYEPLIGRMKEFDPGFIDLESNNKLYNLLV
ncbi:threonine ammonia-lyase IlvA [Streptococcaceae bacterium ESL0687]|nr:threonine ammonia-lyase IlvA [Streptococcaceae bacterium ESL0687]